VSTKKKKKVAKKAFIEDSAAREEAMKAANEENEKLLDLDRKHLNNAQSKKSVQKMKQVSREDYRVPEALEGTVREDEFRIEIPQKMFLKINGVTYNPGVHIVPRHLADTMRPMIQRKMENMANVHVGRNFRLSQGGFGHMTQVAGSGLNVKDMATKG
jgi:hypothetical protein